MVASVLSLQPLSLSLSDSSSLHLRRQLIWPTKTQIIPQERGNLYHCLVESREKWFDFRKFIFESCKSNRPKLPNSAPLFHRASKMIDFSTHTSLSTPLFLSNPGLERGGEGIGEKSGTQRSNQLHNSPPSGDDEERESLLTSEAVRQRMELA